MPDVFRRLSFTGALCNSGDSRRAASHAVSNFYIDQASIAGNIIKAKWCHPPPRNI